MGLSNKIQTYRRLRQEYVCGMCAVCVRYVCGMWTEIMSKPLELGAEKYNWFIDGDALADNDLNNAENRTKRHNGNFICSSSNKVTSGKIFKCSTVYSFSNFESQSQRINDPSRPYKIIK